MKFQLVFFLLIASIFINCQSTSAEKENSSNGEFTTSIKKAKNFEIFTYDGYQKIVIKDPISKEERIYFLVEKNKDVPAQLLGKKIIRTPVEKIVVTSTSHVAMLELLGVENTLIGFPQRHFISSEKTRKLIDSGLVKELGNVQQLNTEILMTIQPELIISFEITGTNKTLQNLEKKGYVILNNTDWLEETPLGRAEWIKFYGIIFSKSKQADKIFEAIETNYNQAKKIASKATTRPTILSGIVFNDIWNLPAGKSFEAQLLKDANTQYLWSETEGTGSLSLSIESVLHKAKSASIWIAPGIYTTTSSLLKSNDLYQHFNSLKNNEVYTYAHNRGKTGGFIYFETAPTRPDLVLKDLIKIAHPELMRHYEFTFYKKLDH